MHVVSKKKSGGRRHLHLSIFLTQHVLADHEL